MRYINLHLPTYLLTDEVGLLGGANQQGRNRWMLVAHVSGPLRLQPELYAQTA